MSRPRTLLSYASLLALSACLTCSTNADSANAEEPKAPGPDAALSGLRAEAGPDYAVQGEYVGTLRHGDSEEKIGAQIVARGNGKFEAWLLRGGLPGAGWDGSETMRYQKTAEGGAVVLEHAGGEHGDGTLAIEGGRLEVRDGKGAVLGKLKRTVRKSPTLHKKPTKEAVVLLDGTTAEHFALERGGPAEMTESGWLKLTRGSRGLTTKRAFGDCTLHLEFLLPFEPTHTGQGRANSGVYFQRRYEVQILDSFGLKGLENECGGIYSSGANPRVNMCLPPLVWQTYDVEFHAPKFDGEGKKTSNG